MCDKTWTVYRLSPLFGVDTSDALLKSWSDSLEEDYKKSPELASEFQQSIKAEVSVLRGLRGTEDDSEALHVRLRTVEGASVYEAILLSVENPHKLVLRNQGGASSFRQYPGRDDKKDRFLSLLQHHYHMIYTLLLFSPMAS